MIAAKRNDEQFIEDVKNVFQIQFQLTAPAYNYSLIDTDVYLVWSRNDVLSPPEGIEKWYRDHTRPGVLKVISIACA